MSTEIYIYGKKVDLYTGTKIGLTKQINDVAEVQKRNADFTNQFTIPATPNNRRISEMLNIAGNNSLRPYKWGTAEIVSNGITITSNAIVLFVNTTKESSFGLRIYSGNYDLLTKINNKDITDLDWSDLTHTFNSVSWQNSLDNTEGYIYGISETLDGVLKTVQTEDNAVDIRYQIPFVFVKTIFKKIMEEANIQWYGKFFDDNETWKNELVAAHDKNPLDFTGRDLDNPVHYVDSSYGSTLTTYHAINAEVVDVDELGAYDNGTFIYTCNKSGRFLISVSTLTAWHYLKNLILIIKKNGVELSRQTIEYNVTGLSGSQAGYRTDIFDFTTDLIISDQITFSYGTEYVKEPGNNIWALSGYYTSATVSVKYSPTNHFNQVIDFSKILPKIKQLEFLTAIMQQFALVYRIDSTGSYEFVTMQDILTAKKGVTELDISSEKTEQYTLGGYAKNNKFLYQYLDIDLVGKDYANSNFKIDIDALANESTVINSIITACGDYFIVSGYGKIASVYAFEKQNDDSYIKRENKELKTVLLSRKNNVLLKFYDSDVNLYLDEDSGLDLPFVVFSPLHWNILKEKYYPKYIKMVERPVVKNVAVWFNPIDIFTLNMFKLIYIEKYQSYFLLNKVNNYQYNTLSDCEIIKIN